VSALSGGTGCYLCMNRAVRTCKRCGRSFCEQHAGLLLGNRCRTCDYDARMGAGVAVGLAVIVLVWWMLRG